MTDTTAHINRRGTLKGQITRILNYTQDIRENIDMTQVKAVKARKERLVELFASFDEVQTSIEDSIGITEEGEKYRGEVEELFFKAIASCEKLIKEEYPTEDSIQNNEYVFNNSTAGSNEVPSSNTTLAPSVKLAALKIPKFTGLYAVWAAFNDIFTMLVHNNEALYKIQKCSTCAHHWGVRQKKAYSVYKRVPKITELLNKR